jgi:hypothetical protein
VRRASTGDSDLSALLDRPLHAIEFEDSEDERHIRGRSYRHFFSQGKLHAFIGHRHDFSPSHHVAAGDIEFLSNLSAQYSTQVGGVFASQRGSISVDFIGDPAAAGQNSVLGYQFSVVSCQLSVTTVLFVRSAAAVSFY